jgi:DNA-binding CsgD family transcriptional regulator
MDAVHCIDRMGDLVTGIGTAEFGQKYYHFFDNLLGIEKCTVFSFCNDGAPRTLIVEACSSQLQQHAKELAAEYVGGEFEKDPNLEFHEGAGGIKVCLLRAADLKDKRYRKRFYEEPGMGHELVLLGRQGGTLFYSSFYRKVANPCFDATDIETINLISRFSLQALNRHSALATSSDCTKRPALTRERREQKIEQLTQIIRSLNRPLSGREAEICAGIMLGYTTLGLSLKLGISINTVATHRKRAYHKLGVSRQNELFSQYFDLANSLN